MAVQINADKINKLSPEYKKIYDELIMPVDTNIDLGSVILSEENQSKINQFITENKNGDLLRRYGLAPMNRLLFYGASGCGKTLTAKALANHMGYTMLYIDISKALSDATVSQNISDIFKLANYLGHCLIMLDECDSIAWQRDQTATGDSGLIRRATNTIFQQLDQMNPTNIFISATNMLHRLDAAFERRFNMKLEYRRPELDLMETIRKFMFEKFTLVDDVSSTVREIVERRAKAYVKLSFYEIQGIVERAMKRSVLNGTDIVKTSDIYNDFAESMNLKIKFNTEQDSEEIFKGPEPHWSK